MAKAISKSPSKADKKAAVPKQTGANKSYLAIENACVSSLAKLQELELDYQLQSEINWCLGSYRNDGNPIGLYQMAQRSLAIFKAEHLNKTKGVTAKLITELEKALKVK